jgi:transposase InsO family protein
MPNTVREYVTRCPVCQRTKRTNQPKPPIIPLPVPARPFEAITLDWISALPTDKHRNDSLLHVVDRFSKWAFSVPTNKSMSSLELCDTLYEQAFSWVGLPAPIVGDRDSRLTASAMRAQCKHLQVKLKLSTGYHPETDGESERFHNTMLQMLRAFMKHAAFLEAVLHFSSTSKLGPDQSGQLLFCIGISSQGPL